MIPRIESTTLLRLILLAVALPTASIVAAATGEASFDADQKLRLRGCGRATATSRIHLLVDADASWTSSVDALSIAGRYASSGRNGRLLDLEPDAASAAALTTRIRTAAAALCESPLADLTASARTFKAKVDRRGRKIALKIVYRVSGTRRGLFQLGGQGPLGPLQTTSSTSTTTLAGPTSTTAGATTSTAPATSSTTTFSTTPPTTASTTTSTNPSLSTTTSTTPSGTSTTSSTEPPLSTTTSSAPPVTTTTASTPPTTLGTTTSTTVVPTTTTTTTTLVSGCYFDTGVTVIDVCHDLEWEKKNGADAAPGQGSPNPANLRDVDNGYAWAGRCSISNTLCQPGTAASNACAAAMGGAVGCAPCGAGEGTCANPEFTEDTIWSWIVQLNGQAFAGHTDWRIPTVFGVTAGTPAELETILDTNVPGCGTTTPCLSPVFGPTAQYAYWSTNQNLGDTTAAWIVNFGGGSSMIPLPKNTFAFVRAVRSRPPTCTDGFRNGAETDVDCGGNACDPCDLGHTCQDDGDCVSDRCYQGHCATFCTGRTAGTPCPTDDNPCTNDVCAADECTHPAGGQGVVCRSADGDCDVEETCTGSDPTCPPDGVRTTLFGCRAPTDLCDVQEFCDGISKTCPADGVYPSGHVCGDLPPACIRPHVCDGTNKACDQTPIARAAQFVCRPPDQSNSCDIDEKCGSSDPGNQNYNADWPDCPIDVRYADGRVCSTDPYGTCEGTPTQSDPGGILTGTCVPTPCRWGINCPDGYACTDGQCVVEPTGVGSACTGDGVGKGTCAAGFCCGGLEGDGVGGIAGAGGSGRCAECCNDVGSTACGGSDECCDGRCVSTDDDPHHCGGCAYSGGGVDCDDYRTACNPTVTSCQFGACQLSTTCPTNTYCTYPVPTCPACPVGDLFCMAGNEPTCFQAPDFGCCDVSCNPIGGAHPVDCGGAVCNFSDRPCCEGFTCTPTCDFATGLFCTADPTCQANR